MRTLRTVEFTARFRVVLRRGRLRAEYFASSCLSLGVHPPDPTQVGGARRAVSGAPLRSPGCPERVAVPELEGKQVFSRVSSAL